MGCVVNVVRRHLPPRYDLFVSYRSLESWIPCNSLDVLLVLNQIPFYFVWPDFRGLPYHLEFFGYLSPVLAHVARFPRDTLSYSLFPVVLSPVVAFVARFSRATIYLPPTAFSGHTPSDHSRCCVDVASLFLSYPQLFSLAQFPRAGTNGVFDTRYILGFRLTYRPRLWPGRAELLCLLKKCLLLQSNLCVCI